MKTTCGDLTNTIYGYVPIPRLKILEEEKDKLLIYKYFPDIMANAHLDYGGRIKTNTNITLQEVADSFDIPVFVYDEKQAIRNKAYAAFVKGMSKLVVNLGSQPKEMSIWAKLQKKRKLDIVSIV